MVAFLSLAELVKGGGGSSRALMNETVSSFLVSFSPECILWALAPNVRNTVWAQWDHLAMPHAPEEQKLERLEPGPATASQGVRTAIIPCSRRQRRFRVRPIYAKLKSHRCKQIGTARGQSGSLQRSSAQNLMSGIRHRYPTGATARAGNEFVKCLA